MCPFCPEFFGYHTVCSLQDVSQVLYQPYKSGSASGIELPQQIAHPPLIDTVIDAQTTTGDKFGPRARVIVARIRSTDLPHAEKQFSSRYLLHYLLDSISGEDNHRWTICYTQSGAPVLANQDELNLSIGLSRSGKWLAVAVAEAAQIGVDIESIRPRRNQHKIAQFLKWKSDLVDTLDFYTKWTLWEATAKCVGGSVLMGNNQGFEQLCMTDTFELLGQAGEWHGFSQIHAGKVSYSVAMKSTLKHAMSYHYRSPENLQPWLSRTESIAVCPPCEFHQCA